MNTSYEAAKSDPYDIVVCGVEESILSGILAANDPDSEKLEGMLVTKIYRDIVDERAMWFTTWTTKENNKVTFSFKEIYDAIDQNVALSGSLEEIEEVNIIGEDPL